jgi:hypothetical protein
MTGFLKYFKNAEKNESVICEERPLNAAGGEAKEPLLCFEEMGAEAHVVGMGILETLVGRIQLREIFQGVFPDLMHRRAVIYKFSLL